MIQTQLGLKSCRGREPELSSLRDAALLILCSRTSGRNRHPGAYLSGGGGRVQQAQTAGAGRTRRRPPAGLQSSGWAAGAAAAAAPPAGPRKSAPGLRTLLSWSTGCRCSHHVQCGHGRQPQRLLMHPRSSAHRHLGQRGISQHKIGLSTGSQSSAAIKTLGCDAACEPLEQRYQHVVT